MFELRDYQEEACAAVERHKKNLIYASTGSGKSVVFKKLALDGLASGDKVLFIVKRQQVLSQAVNKHFLTIHNNVSMMMGANKFRFVDILCCSMDTLYRRQQLYSKLLEDYQYVIIDEAHDCTADNYQSYFTKLTNQTVVGLTATPFLVGKKTHHFWDKVIHPVSTLDLIKKGYLVWPEVWMSHQSMTTKNVKTTAGDYNSKQLFDANNNSTVYGSIVDEYKKHAFGKRCFTFCINVEHSKKIAEEYNAAGIPAVHCDADTPLEERERVLKAFAKREIWVITNVNIFSTGTDVPEAEVGQMCRPTKSLILWIQQVGRILRPCPEIGKTKAIILDHTDNTMRLGHPAMNDFVAETDMEKVKENQEKKIPLYQCKVCFYVYGEKTDACPMCGATNEVKERKIKEEKEAELRKFDAKKELDRKAQEEKSRKDQYYNFKNKYFIQPTSGPKGTAAMLQRRDDLLDTAFKKNWKLNSVFFKLHNEYGEASRVVLKYPIWFDKIINEQLQESSKSNSENYAPSSEGIS